MKVIVQIAFAAALILGSLGCNGASDEELSSAEGGTAAGRLQTDKGAEQGVGRPTEGTVPSAETPP